MVLRNPVYPPKLGDFFNLGVTPSPPVGSVLRLCIGLGSLSICGVDLIPCIKLQ